MDLPLPAIRDQTPPRRHSLIKRASRALAQDPSITEVPAWKRPPANAGDFVRRTVYGHDGKGAGASWLATWYRRYANCKPGVTLDLEIFRARRIAIISGLRMINAPFVLLRRCAGDDVLVWAGAEIGAAGLASYRRRYRARALQSARAVPVMDNCAVYSLNVGVCTVGAIVWLLRQRALGWAFALVPDSSGGRSVGCARAGC